MKKKKKILVSELNVDVLRHIMLCVARSPGGARSVARALSVSKSFRELENDTELLKSVAFEKRSLREYPQSFWGINGLLTRCACARNPGAHTIFMEYVEEQLEFWSQEIDHVEKVATFAFETQEAYMAVNTRGRKRAAKLAMEECNESLKVTRKGFREFRDQLRALNPRNDV